MAKPERPENIGLMLKRLRQEKNLSLTDIELATKIRGKYLLELESGDYSKLPNDIYIRNFVQSYADHLGLEGRDVAKQYQAERGDMPPGQPHVKPVERRRFVLTPKIAVAAVSLLVAAGVVAYLAYQFTALASAPKIELTAPTGDQVIYGNLVDVSGSVSGGADVFVNDSPLLTDANGNFSDKLALQDGVNTLRITAKNKLGKSATVTRSILAHLPAVDNSAAAVAPATFDGVQLVVSIKNAATALVVTVDGREAFRGTMLPGTMQGFKGGDIKITTSNAGNTNVVWTNSVVAAKKAEPLGKDSQVLRQLDFSKTTDALAL